MKEITLTLVEIFISLIVETIILGGLFTWVSNKSSKEMQQKMTDELNNIEIQNKFNYEQLKNDMLSHRNDILSQIKESKKG